MIFESIHEKYFKSRNRFVKKKKIVRKKKIE